MLEWSKSFRLFRPFSISFLTFSTIRNFLKIFARRLRLRRRAQDVNMQALGSWQRSAAAWVCNTRRVLSERCVSGRVVKSCAVFAVAARRDLHMRRYQAMRVVELQGIAPEIVSFAAQARVFAQPITAKAVRKFTLRSRLAVARGDARGNARIAKIRVNGRFF